MLQMFVSSQAQASETFIDQLWPPNLKINPLYVIHNDLRMPTSLSLYKISNTSIQIIHNLFLPLKNYIVSKQFKMADENLHKSMLKMSAQDFRVLQIFFKAMEDAFPLPNRRSFISLAACIPSSFKFFSIALLRS